MAQGKKRVRTGDKYFTGNCLFWEDGDFKNINEKATYAMLWQSITTDIAGIHSRNDNMDAHRVCLPYSKYGDTLSALEKSKKIAIYDNHIWVKSGIWHNLFKGKCSESQLKAVSQRLFETSNRQLIHDVVTYYAQKYLMKIPMPQGMDTLPTPPPSVTVAETEPVAETDITIEPPKPGPTPPVKIPNPDHKEFVKFFTEEYQNRFNVKYDFVGGRDGNLIKGLLKTFGLELLRRITLEFFNSDDQFIKEKTGFTVPALKMRANQIAANLSRNKTFMDKLSPSGRETLKNAAAWMARTEGINANK